MKHFQPDGRHTVTPRIITPKPEELVHFIKEVFRGQGAPITSNPPSSGICTDVADLRVVAEKIDESRCPGLASRFPRNWVMTESVKTYVFPSVISQPAFPRYVSRISVRPGVEAELELLEQD